MKHKKKERLLADDKLSEYEKHQNDHEQFLQTFEKPTQIYRYIRTRHMQSPIFLQRNLSYMKDRILRKNKKRTNFIIDKFKDSLIKREQQNGKNRSENLHLDIQGVYTNDEFVENVEVEVFLIHSAHRHRKSNTLKKGVKIPVTQTKVGSVSAPLNPKEKNIPATVTIYTSQINVHNGCNSKGFSLLLRVKCTPSNTVKPCTKPISAFNGLLNGHVTSDTGAESSLDRFSLKLSASDDESDDQPSKKKRKTRKCNRKSNLVPILDENMDKAVYDCEQIVYDGRQRKLLIDGQYEAIMYDSCIEKGEMKHEYSTVKEEIRPFDAFGLNPVLKYGVRWTTSLTTNDVQLDQSLPSPTLAITPTNTQGKPSNAAPEANNNNNLAAAHTSPAKPRQQRIFYHFLYNNKTRQQTEARTDMHCPWCLLNCAALYPLLKHLRNCHARFNFTYYEHPKGARIDVSINENYDGSYVSNPLDLQGHIGYCFGSLGPVQRTEVTQVIVYKPKKPSFDLCEFMEPETEGQQPRNTTHGHNRLYNHTVTLQSIRPSEMEVDSEDDLDPEWLRVKTVNLIDEFTDVNEGEKEIMKMWNIHIMNHNFIGDCLVPRACTMFIQEYGPEIIQRNLCRNFIVHLTNLCDFGLIKSDMVSKSTLQLFRLRAKMHTDGLLSRKTSVHVNKKWDPLRNYTAVPIVTQDSKVAPKLVPDTNGRNSSLHSGLS